MRISRIGLVVAWGLVASLAVAGFAAFSASEDDAPQGPSAITIAAIAPDLGRSAGVVAGLSFVYLGEQSGPQTTVDFDAVVQRTITRRVEQSVDTTTTTAAAAGTRDTRGSVFIRSRFLGEAEIRLLIGRYFAAEDVNRAVRIAWCESSFNPEAVNPVTGAGGLFQHLPEYWAERSAAAGVAGADPLDAEANVAVAAWLLYNLPGGWSHWDCQA